MASTAQTLSTANAILKDLYDGWADALMNKTVLLSRLKKRTGKMVGDHLVWAIHTGGNDGIGASYADTSTTNYLPTPGAQEYVQCSLQAAHYHGGFAINRAALSAAANGGGLVELMKQEMDGVQKDMGKAVNIDLYRDGSGALAKVTATASSATQTVDEIRYLKVTTADNYTSGLLADGSDAASLYFTTITPSTTGLRWGPGTVVMDTTDSMTASYGYFRLGINGTQATRGGLANAGFTGTPQIVTCGLEQIVNSFAVGGGLTYAGVTRTATKPYMDANLINGAEGLSIDMMQQMGQDMRDYGDGEPKLIITSPVQWRKYGDLLWPDRRWVDKVTTLDGGFKALDWNGIPLVEDVDCPPSKMYFLDLDDFYLDEQESLHALDDTGAILRPVGSGATALDQVEARFVWRFQLTCKRPSAQGCIYGLPT